jgi:hypothetical protein
MNDPHFEVIISAAHIDLFHQPTAPVYRDDHVGLLCGADRGRLIEPVASNMKRSISCLLDPFEGYEGVSIRSYRISYIRSPGFDTPAVGGDDGNGSGALSRQYHVIGPFGFMTGQLFKVCVSIHGVIPTMPVALFPA